MSMIFVATTALVLAIQNGFKEFGYWVPEKDIQTICNSVENGRIRYTAKADGREFDIRLIDSNGAWHVNIFRLR